MKNLYYGQIEEIKNNFYFGYMAARKLERADYVETISGLRKPEAKKIKAAV